MSTVNLVLDVVVQEKIIIFLGVPTVNHYFFVKKKATVRIIKMK